MRALHSVLVRPHLPLADDLFSEDGRSRSRAVAAVGFSGGYMAFNVLECIDRYVSIYVCSMIRCLRLAALISDVQMGQLIGCVRV